MRAYYLSIKDNDDAGQEIVFANTAKEAKKKIHTLYDDLDNYLDLRVNRAKEYDGMEKLSPAQLAFVQWQNGWRWFDVDYPDPDTATEAEFMEWYDSYFGGAFLDQCGTTGRKTPWNSHVCTCNHRKSHEEHHGCSCRIVWDNK